MNPATPRNDGIVPSGRRVAVMAAVTGVLLTGLGGLLVATVLGGKAEGVCSPGLQAAIAKATANAGHATAILVDAYSNDRRAAERVVEELRPDLENALAVGGAIELAVDRGDEHGVAVDACLDGSRSFRIEHENVRRQAQEREQALQEMADAIMSMLTRGPVDASGGPVELFQHADAAVAAAVAEAGPTPRIVLWSDFLSTGRDCLNPEGEIADEATIDAIVRRCAITGAIPALEAPLTIAGVGTTPRSRGFESWARDLAGRVCSLASSVCTVR